MPANELTRLIDPATEDTSSDSLSSSSSLEREDSEEFKGLQYPGDVRFVKLKEEQEEKTFPESKPLFPRVDPNAFQFALRMAVLLTVSSLFVLIKTDTWSYPDGMWVLVSVLFVCWFPSLDAASVIEKVIQRLIGTVIGSILGLSCGFFSIWAFPTRTRQAIFLGVCMFIYNFGIIFLAGQCKVGEAKVIRRYAYATILCVLTFCICMLPFALDKDPKWLHGVWRVCNVIVGCLLGAIGSILVCPKSTTAVLHDKTARQVKLCGEASEAVLHMAADHFAGKVEVPGLADELMNAPLGTTLKWKINHLNSGNISECSKTSNNADVALKKYEDAIEDWKASKMLFPLTKYDPFHLSWGKEKQFSETKAFNKEIARTLARSLRIQTTIVMLDGMVRHDTQYEFDDQELLMFSEVGTRIRQMLTLPLEITKSNSAALALFSELETIRKKILKLSEAVSKPENFQELSRTESMMRFKDSLLEEDGDFLRTDDDAGRGIPKFASDSHDNSLFFLQLVEHLILRSLRLFQAWKLVEVKASKLEDKSLRVLVSKAQGNGPRPGDSLRSMIVA
jgi:hypothetical protein